MSTTANSCSAAQLINIENAATTLAQQQKHGKCRIRNLLSTVAILVALLLVVGAIYMHLKQNHRLGRLNIDLAENDVQFVAVTAPAVEALRSTPLVSDECLACIAATATANKPAICGKFSCGIYRIYRPYWQDALLAVPSIGSLDYESCVSSAECATEAVRGFIKSYGRDCDGNEVIQCRDHIMLHLLGPTGCQRRTPLSPLLMTRMAECLSVKKIE